MTDNATKMHHRDLAESINESLFEAQVLVTGGAGFIGSNLVAQLLHHGADVTVLDDLSTGRLALLPKASALEVIEGSVCDEELVRDVIAQDYDFVFHLAARNIIASTKNPRDDFATNIRGTLNILLSLKELASARALKRFRRLVYTSTTSVYGNPRYLPISEDDPIWILSPYACSKYAAENYCICFYESYALPTVVVRYSNVYGRNQSPQNPYCGVVSKFFAQVMQGEPAQIHGDGKQTRDFTYISDAVMGTVVAATSQLAEGEVFNVGTGIETSVLDLAYQIARVCGKPDVAPKHIDKRDIDNIRRRVVNIEKIRRRLHWTPQVAIEQGLELTYQWLSEAANHQNSSEDLA